MLYTPESDPRPEVRTRDLLGAAREGDSDAWESLYRRYRVGLLLAVRRQLGERSLRARETEDILQSAFLNAWDHIRKFEYRGEGSFRAWLRALVVNKVRSRLREPDRERPLEGRNRSNGEDSDREVGHLPADEVAPPQILAKRQEEAWLFRCLEQLPALEREAVVQRQFEGKPWREIAEVLEVSQATAQRAYRRGIGELTRRMGRENDSQ